MLTSLHISSVQNTAYEMLLGAGKKTFKGVSPIFTVMSRILTGLGGVNS